MGFEETMEHDSIVGYDGFQSAFEIPIATFNFHRDSPFQQQFIISASNMQSLFSMSKSYYDFNFQLAIQIFNAQLHLQLSTVIRLFNSQTTAIASFNHSLTFQHLTVIATFNHNLVFQRSTAIPIFNHDLTFQHLTAISTSTVICIFSVYDSNCSL